MSRSFSKPDLRGLSLILAVVLLLVSFPSTPGLVIVPGPSQPELTVNICQPIQTFDRVADLLFVHPTTVFFEFVLRDLGSNVITATVRLTDCTLAPDTPPPKSLV